MTRSQRIILGVFLFGAVLFLYALIGFPGLFEIYIDRLNQQATPRVYAIARELGYTDASFVKEHAYCSSRWLFGMGNCTKLLHFTTDETLEQFQSHIDTLPKTMGSAGMELVGRSL